MDKESSIQFLRHNLRCYYAHFVISRYGKNDKLEKTYYKHMMKDLMYHIDFLNNFDSYVNFTDSNNIENI